jgi:hypothetical protein
LTWAGNHLARQDEDPDRLVGDWAAEQLPNLADPTQANRTLEWLFNRSLRGLDEVASQVLSAAALLAHAPFPLAAIEAGIGELRQCSEKDLRDAIRLLTQRSLFRRLRELDHWQFAHVLGYRFARKKTGAERAIRVGLGRWLRASINESLTGVAAGVALGRDLEHLTALLRTDDDQSLWNPLVNWVLYDAADRLSDMGRLTFLKTASGREPKQDRRRAELPG